MIRQACKNDLTEIAFVHSICFPDSYLTQMGKYKSSFLGGRLLEAFYQEYMDDNPELFLVAEDPQKGVVGFCMGYYMDKEEQMQNFMRHNKLMVIWKTGLLLLFGNKQTWNKVFGRLKHKPSIDDWIIVNDKYEAIQNNERGDLLSVCVLPDYRGKGYAQEMMEQYLTVMKDRGKKLCLLSVKTDNIRARRYYERNGFELYRTRGDEGLTYLKRL